MSIEPLLLLRYRLTIARLGEQDLFSWWDSNALTEEGQYALGRLFRQTSIWVSVELALEAARFRHEAVVPPGDRITLYNLGPEIEDSFTSWFRRAKAGNQVAAVKLPAVPEAARATVGNALRALDFVVEETKLKDVGDRAIHVGQIDRQELRTNALPVVQMLLPAYLKSSKGQFLAPYATLGSIQR